MLKLNLNLYDFHARNYDPTIGRWLSVDLLAEQAPDWTPYRFGFNNPIMFTDPTGLFEKRSDARKYRRENDIEGRIQRNSEGGFSINDKKNSISYTAGDDSDPKLIDSRPNDGVVESVLVGNGGGSVGQSGEWESVIPIWGSGRTAVDHFQNGNYWRGAGYTALAISDVFLVKSIATGVGRGAWKAGSHSWSATRKWMSKKGYAKPGEPVHHWAVHQATAKKYGIEAVTNQPWNLMTFPNQSLHMQAGHGMNYLGQPGYGIMGQFWYGTPTWFKSGIISSGERVVD